jgi:hypothetical protein
VRRTPTFVSRETPSAILLCDDTLRIDRILEIPLPEPLAVLRTPFEHIEPGSLVRMPVPVGHGTCEQHAIVAAVDGDDVPQRIQQAAEGTGSGGRELLVAEPAAEGEELTRRPGVVPKRVERNTDHCISPR